MPTLKRLVYVGSLCSLGLSGCDTAPKAPWTAVEAKAKSAANYPTPGTTYLHWDQGHGYQVTYVEDGRVWL